MQFKHPELLYALFLLLIPIFIHLFQLRKFKKTPFTNVKFLKKVTLQTRKSSRLKKFLVLCSRLLLFAAIILAFAQPFLSSSDNIAPTETYIYLDNSLSMQAKGEQGELLKRSVQQLIENVPEDGKVQLFTNDKFYNNLSFSELKNTLLSLDYSAERANLNLRHFQMEEQIGKSGNAATVYFISDFQEKNISDSLRFRDSNQYYFIQLTPKDRSNMAVDSLYISNAANNQLQLTAAISNYGDTDVEVPVTLYNNNILSGRSSVSLSKGEQRTIDYTIPANTFSAGYISVTDANVPFDNNLYFAIDKPEIIPVAVMGNQYDYLSKIYTPDEFLLRTYTVQAFDFNTITDQQVVILHELEQIPDYLVEVLQKYVAKGGNLVIVPAMNSSLADYDRLFKQFGLGRLTEKVENTLAITGINYRHPLLKGVFEKEVHNFQYPEVKSYFKGNLQNTATVLRFQDDQPFLSSKKYLDGNVYWFSASINSENSNFKNSPLIVPVFYNFGLFSFKDVGLYYINGVDNSLDIKGSFSKDDVIKLKVAAQEYIPLQQLFADKATIVFKQLPFKSGFIDVVRKDSVLKKIALNYNRSESLLDYVSLENFVPEAENVHSSNTIKEMFAMAADRYKQTELWKFFVLLALLAVLIEFLLLRFLKG